MQTIILIQESATRVGGGDAINVRWRRIVREDGVIVADGPHRKSYVSAQLAEFLAEVEGAAEHAAAAGWIP